MQSVVMLTKEQLIDLINRNYPSNDKTRKIATIVSVNDSRENDGNENNTQQCLIFYKEVKV